LRARPVNRHFRECVEIAGRFFERGLLVVISLYDRTLQLLHDLDALMRIRVVADDVAETDEMSALALLGIGEDGFGRFEIGVKVAKNGKTHEEIGGLR
jgi:hypothetical protein